MTKRSCIIGMIISFPLGAGMIYLTEKVYIEGCWFFIPMFFVSFSFLLAFLWFLSDYRYLNGSFTPKQLDNSRHGTYWYLKHGKDRYYEYRKTYGFNGRYAGITSKESKSRIPTQSKD